VEADGAEADGAGPQLVGAEADGAGAGRRSGQPQSVPHSLPGRITAVTATVIRLTAMVMGPVTAIRLMAIAPVTVTRLMAMAMGAVTATQATAMAMGQVTVTRLMVMVTASSAAGSMLPLGAIGGNKPD